MYQEEINQHYLTIRWKGKRKRLSTLFLRCVLLEKREIKKKLSNLVRKEQKATTFFQTNSIGTMLKQGKRTSKTNSYTIISKTWLLTTFLAIIFPKQKLYTTTFLLLIKKKKRNKAKRLKGKQQWWAKKTKTNHL